MYTVTTDDETQQQLDALPAHALAPFAELRTTLEVAPWNGAPLNRFKPDSPVRTYPFGPHGEGMTTYLILEDQRALTWSTSSGWIDHAAAHCCRGR